jgi:ketosteroid isomerase-like protein
MTLSITTPGRFDRRTEFLMNKRSISRRFMLRESACALVAAAAAPGVVRARTQAGLNPEVVRTVRRYYAAWQNGNWHSMDLLLTDNFTFTSPKDHDGKGLFKTRCWDPNVNLIGRFDLQLIAGVGDDALVMYVCNIKGGKEIENVEHLHIRHGKIESVRCYFGEENSYPAAVIGGKA